ncbi:hypothetical protein F2P56_028207 [Juglans regia]|uniref:Uncharacterized protein LOC109010994 isoform X4 n=3 Tax=Juglans regia TaxID=51240 RepID=A0A6P9DUS5_JUGRE|nr:uncharacterized protein LOC109010994 isoform X4 [Juglans regia]KAF5453295.1 hypothetical protein F2P56_028207 [Juglans regia]
MTSSEGELEEQLKETGNKLLNPPSSIDELLNLLDKVESLLANVEQAPSESMKDALLPSMKALIANELLTHSEMDVKVSVASCLTEITRITAPDAPYNDDQMKEIFHLTVAAFEQLPYMSSRCYTKAVSILETVAKVRSCLVMLDLECDSLVVEMFQNFLKGLRSNQPHTVFSAMETIMTLVIDESEEISSDLLVPLLASVKKENETASPIEWELGERIITNCAVKLEHCLKEAVQSMGIALDEYSQTVASICQSGSVPLEHEHVNGYGEHSADDKLEESTDSDLPPKTDPNEPPQVTEGLAPDTVCGTKVGQLVDGTLKSAMSNGIRNDETLKNEKTSKSLQSRVLAKHSKSIGARSNAEPGSLGSTKAAKSEIERVSVPKKRGRKPNSLMNPEEGYDHTWISPGRKTTITHRRKSHDGGVDDTPSENPDSSMANLSLENVTEPSAFEAKTNEIVVPAAPSPEHGLPDSSLRKRGRPKKKGNTANQDADPDSHSRSKGRFLKAHVGEKALQSADLSMKKESEVLSNCNTKAQGRSRKIRIATTPKEETTVAPGYVVSEKEADVPCVPEEKHPCPSTMNVDGMNDKSLIQLVIKKRKRGDVPSKQDISETSGSKMISKSATKSTNRDDSYLEETSKSKLKRMRTTGKKESSEKSDLDEQLVGSRIKVWWPLDKMFYEGVVNSYDPVKKKHQVLYADGDEEVLNLKKECWELVGDNVLPVGQETNAQEPCASSDLLQKRRGKAKSKSAKREIVDSSSKRSGALGGRSEVVERTESGGNSADNLEPDKPIVGSESVNDPSMAEDGLKDDHIKSTGKLRIERLKTGTNLMQNVPKATTLPKGFL